MSNCFLSQTLFLRNNVRVTKPARLPLNDMSSWSQTSWKQPAKLETFIISRIPSSAAHPHDIKHSVLLPWQTVHMGPFDRLNSIPTDVEFDYMSINCLTNQSSKADYSKIRRGKDGWMEASRVQLPRGNSRSAFRLTSRPPLVHPKMHCHELTRAKIRRGKRSLPKKLPVLALFT